MYIYIYIYIYMQNVPASLGYVCTGSLVYIIILFQLNKVFNIA